MSILTTTNSLCKGMDQAYAGLVGPAKAAQAAIDSLWNQMDSGLNVLKNIGFSPQSALDAAVDSLKDQASAFFPGDQLEDMETIQNLIEQCDFLNLLQPVSSLLAGVTGLFDEIDSLIDGISLTLPEFGIGNLLGSISDALQSLKPGGLDLSGLLGSADDMINCLSLLCGPGFAGQAGAYGVDIANLYSDLHLYDSGLLKGLPKVEELYDSIGMSSIEKTAMNAVNDGIEATKNDALAAIDSSIASVKSFTTIGGIFG